MPAGGRSPGQDRDHARGAHDPGALDRRPGARERDVDGDQREHREPPRDVPDPEQRRRAERERGEQHDVLPARRHEVREPGGPQVVAQALGQRVVLAEDHAPHERAPPRAGTPVLSARSARVRTASIAPAGPPRRRPVAAIPSAESSACTPRRASHASCRRSRVEDAADAQLGAHGRRRPAHARARAQQGPLAVQPDDGGSHAERAPPGRLEQRDVGAQRVPELRAEPRVGRAPRSARARPGRRRSPHRTAARRGRRARRRRPRPQPARRSRAASAIRPRGPPRAPPRGRARAGREARRARRLPRRSRSSRRPSRLHALPEGREPLGTDARHLAQVVDAPKSAVLACGRRGSSPPSPGRRRRACRAARPSRC